MTSVTWGLLKTYAGSIFLLSVLSASLFLNVALGLKLRGSQPIVRSLGVREHVSLRSIPAVDTNGRNVMITFDDPRRTVLYVLSPSCHWCARNSANITSLSQAKSHEYRFIGLSNTETDFRQHVAATPFSFPLFAVNSKQLQQSADLTFLEQLDLTVTPQTIVIGPGGIVEKVWVGAFDRRKQNEVERFFGVSLSGLLDLAQTPANMHD